eukprot:112403-Chlamydomonas_euryale.AAC.1
MEKHAASDTNAAKRVRLCLPLPPTPTSIAEPRGWRRMRAMRLQGATGMRSHCSMGTFVSRGWTHERMGGWKDGREGGRMEGWMEGWQGGTTDADA